MDLFFLTSIGDQARMTSKSCVRLFRFKYINYRVSYRILDNIECNWQVCKAFFHATKDGQYFTEVKLDGERENCKQGLQKA